MISRTIIVFLILVVFCDKVIAQDMLKKAEAEDSKRDAKTYIIKSLEGKSQKIHIMPDYVNRILNISCLKDTIHVYDYWDVPTENAILNKSFIAIHYAVRGGSNVGLGNVLIVCVSGNRLYEAIHVLEYITGETEAEQDLYKIKIALDGMDKKNYKLNVSIHDKVNSKTNPEINYNYRSQTVLSFDTSRNIFYSMKENIYDSFTIYNQTDKEHKERLKGNYPAIILGNETYYYIKDGWYSKANNNVLNFFTYRSGK